MRMATKVAPKEDDELAEIVEEAQRLDDAQRDRLSREETREVLRDLDINPETLEAAEAVVAERRAARAKKQRMRMALAAVALAVMGLAAGGIAWSRHTAAQLAHIVVTSHGVTAHGEPAPFRAEASPELTMDAVIQHAPEGASLDLACTWSDPSGTISHENHWKTKPIDHDAWSTHCRTQLKPSAPRGSWTVTMKQGNRVLATESFEVQ